MGACIYKISLLHQPDDHIGRMVSQQAAPHSLQQNCAHALANTKKSLRNDGERGCGWLYQNLTSQENTQKNAKEKNTKAKIEAKWGPVFTFSLPGPGAIRPSGPRQLRHHCFSHSIKLRALNTAMQACGNTS